MKKEIKLNTKYRINRAYKQTDSKERMAIMLGFRNYKQYKKDFEKVSKGRW